MADGVNYRTRIVGHEEVDPKTIKFNPNNYRMHGDDQKNVMQDLLQSYGWVQDVIVNKNTGNLLDGEMRVRQALQNREPTVPVVWVDLTEEEERELILAFNMVGNMATINVAKVAVIAKQFRNDRGSHIDALVQQIVEQNKPKETQRDQEKPGEESTEEETEEHAELVEKYSVHSGQVWRLGKHVLICGNCKDDKVIKVLQEYHFNCVCTDPPYGIDAVGSDGKIGYGKKFGRIEGDMEPFDPGHLFGYSDNLILWGANHYSDKLPSSPVWLIWDKREGDRHNDQADAEVAWCSGKGVVRIFSHLWMGFAKASERTEPRMHPTQKPVAVIAWALQERTKPNDLVLDPYSGAGTIILACEQSKRIAVCVELEPRYVAASIHRFERFTDQKAELLREL